MDIKRFKHDDWTKIFEGSWSFLTSTYYIQQYTVELKYGGRPFNSQSIIFSTKGKIAAWMRQSDRDRLGTYLSGLVSRDPKQAAALANQLMAQIKSFTKYIDAHMDKAEERDVYDEFWKRLVVYYHPHISVKYVVDYLHPDLLDKYLPELEAARLAAEPVFNRSEEFMVVFAKKLGKKADYDYKLVMCLTKEELEDYYKTKALPEISELAERYTRSVMMRDEKEFAFFTGKEVDKIENLLKIDTAVSLVKGSVAYAGIVKGAVRVVPDPQKVKVFNKGDILVAGSTRPEYLPIMHKAGAFVTDAGGILSHAAITAREMKKPCVIGTRVATKVFKDGDKVEVDAEKGVVRKVV